ncbi:MAG: ComEC/Rec2 family competence protein [Campylobacterota bacterium]|nr:ComEC/Rec2 family competence protein [Campylobacterota bacterium]
MDSLSLFKTNKERLYFLFILFVIFVYNVSVYYVEFREFKDEEIYKTDAIVLNIYDKKSYKVLKLQSNDFVCFTSTIDDINLNKLDNINIYLLTENITFFNYLQGFYTKNFNITKLISKNNLKKDIRNYIYNQHENKTIASLYTALFLAIPVSKDLRELFSQYGVSHLVAISGFHLGIISLVLYFIFTIIYSPIHQNYFPYRNKRLDILIIITTILFLYLIFLNIVPSLLRAFVMFVFGIFLLRNNIKLFSFESLLIITLVILALFPKLLFSLSLWFSIMGVFYILLFVQYFKNLNKYMQIILFNFWLYLAVNPITHYFFGITAYEQLLSPILTILFTIFYTSTILLHILNFGNLFDIFLLDIFSHSITHLEIFTPVWFFVLYLIVSIASIFNRYLFYLLNILFIGFNLYIYI